MAVRFPQMKPPVPAVVAGADDETEEEEHDETETSSTEHPWSGILMLVGETTTDGREFVAAGMTVRDLPLPLWYLPTNPHGGMFDQPGQLAGRIDTVELVGTQLRGTGVIDTSLEAGEAPVTAIRSGAMRWVSADNGASAYEEVELNGCECDYETGEGCDECSWLLRFTEWEFMGATILGIPAFPQAVIALDGDDLDTAAEDGEEAAEVLLAALGVAPRPCCSGCAETNLVAGGSPTEPPAAWFDDPALAGPTPLTVTDDGRVFGHLALFNTCHTGYRSECVMVPRSNAGYAYFTTGAVRTAEGATRRVGQLTIGSGHAPLRDNARTASEHYDNAATAWADVSAGEDDHGVWVAGSIRPSLSDDTLRAARASALSGDWRDLGGNLELVAALSVNVPGFPVLVASAGEAERGNTRVRVVDDRAVSLVAAGIARPVDPLDELRRELLARIEAVERVTVPLRSSAAERLLSGFRK